MSKRRPVRSAQLISPFGVGSMMDFPGPESLVQAGLDAWTPHITDPSKVFRNELCIRNEPALAKRLGVDFFVTPPVSDERPDAPTIPYLRFPRWHQCPRCSQLIEAKNLHDEAPRCSCTRQRSGVPTQQVRFVAACRNGHLRDFPWLEWLASKGGIADATATETRRKDLARFRLLMRDGASLRLKSTGLSGGQGIKILLEQPSLISGGQPRLIAERNLAGAFGGKADSDDVDATPLSRIGVRCQSENPALGISTGSGACAACDAPLYVALRGAGNLYFADVESAIHVPDTVPGKLNEELLNLFERDELVRSLLREAGRSQDGKLSIPDAQDTISKMVPWMESSADYLRPFVDSFNELEPFRQLSTNQFLSEKLRQLRNSSAQIDKVALQLLLTQVAVNGGPIGRWDVVPEGLLPKIEDWLDDKTGTRLSVDGTGGRRHEYTVFGLPSHLVEGRPKSILKLRSYPATSYSEVVSTHFDHVALLDTLRETRVLKGYSRLFARQQRAEEYLRLMWRNPPTEPGRRWLPATMVFGEGIFFRFAEGPLRLWESRFGDLHNARLETMNHNLHELALRRGHEPAIATPRRVLVHTFAHLLINQLVFDSGYGSSSLRERLYVSPPSDADQGMAGVLIYTAAGDTEGSMGGLVRLGEPGALERTLERALERALWCSSDPVCIESKGQGPDSCNVAACHSCSLLPETSCEEQNRLLDRGVVIGTLDMPRSGFFDDFLKL